MEHSNLSEPISDFAVQLIDFNGYTYDKDSITQDVMEQLIKFIQTTKKASIYLSLDEYGEDEDSFLTLDINNGWAAIAFNSWDENGISYMYQPVNKENNRLEEAPVCIGGQTPVSKRNALQDMKLVAECVQYFAKTGERYSCLDWEMCDP